MVATVANVCAWIGCAVLAFALIKDFVSVELESRNLEKTNEQRNERGERREGGAEH